MQAFIDEIRKPRGRTVLEEKTLSVIMLRSTERGPRGPASFVASSLPRRMAAAIVRICGVRAVSATVRFLTYWYFHLPNFVLAALMYTLLGRALLALFVEPDSSNYIWRFFCRITDPVVAAVALVTPKAAAPVVIWLFGFVWLFWLRVLCSMCSCCGRSPAGMS